jgi:hypothetical protein
VPTRAILFLAKLELLFAKRECCDNKNPEASSDEFLIKLLLSIS